MNASSAESAVEHEQPTSSYLGVARPARVLLADDDPELRRHLAGTLRKDGYEVEEVVNGLELLMRASQPSAATPPVDLVISDIRMPGMTGLDVLAGLRSPLRPRAWHAPFIFITAFGDREAHAAAARLGAAILDKPFDLDDLRTCAINLVSPVQVDHARAQPAAFDEDLFPGCGRE